MDSLTAVGHVPVYTTRERFRALWGRCLIEGGDPNPKAIYDEIVRRYGESHRRYHRRAHIDCCLALADLAAGETGVDDGVELALWFHDLIYDPGAADNERRSAERFDALSENHFDPAFRRRVYDLIMATSHSTCPLTPDACLVVDIDLASFGLPWPAFRNDGTKVRAEFGHVPDDVFYPQQIAFLRSLIARPHFFCTEFFRARREAQAQENIRRYMEELRAKGYD